MVNGVVPYYPKTWMSSNSLQAAHEPFSQISGLARGFCYLGVMSPDDPEYLSCTCVHRTLKDHEKVQFWTPGGIIHTYAKDCPEHGIRYLNSEMEASPETA
jgi:hypothetical protein